MVTFALVLHELGLILQQFPNQDEKNLLNSVQKILRGHQNILIQNS